MAKNTKQANLENDTEIKEARAWYSDSEEKETSLSVADLLDVIASVKEGGKWNARRVVSAMLEKEQANGKDNDDDNDKSLEGLDLSITDDRAIKTARDTSDELLAICSEMGELNIRRKVLPLMAADQMLADFGKDYIVTEIPDINTRAKDVKDDNNRYRVVDNNPEYMNMPGKGTKPVKSSYFDAWFRTSKVGAAIVRAINDLGDTEGKFNEAGEKATLTSKLNAGATVLKQAAGYIKMKAELEDLYGDDLHIVESRDREGEWRFLATPIVIQPKERDAFKRVSVSQFVNLSLQRVRHLLKTNSKMTVFQAIEKAMGPEEAETEEAPPITMENYKDELTRVIVFLRNKAVIRDLSGRMTAADETVRYETAQLFHLLHKEAAGLFAQADKVVEQEEAAGDEADAKEAAKKQSAA